jgi:hypothetical protein
MINIGLRGWGRRDTYGNRSDESRYYRIAAAPVEHRFKIELSHLEHTDRCWFYWASFDRDRIIKDRAVIEPETLQFTQPSQRLEIDDLILTEIEIDQFTQPSEGLDINDLILTEIEQN